MEYFPQLRAMQKGKLLAAASMASVFGPIPPEEPKQPINLGRLLRSYASALFYAEANRYPSEYNSEYWFSALADRIAVMVEQRLDKMETPMSTLTFHATPLEMMRAVSAALKDCVNERLSIQVETLGPPPALPAAAWTRQVPSDDGQPKLDERRLLPQPQQESRAEVRKAAVVPILDEKGWSILAWATEADVAYHTAADYLAGSTAPYRSTRVKLAKALGISVNSLPE